jgi:hypothetical protein
MFSQYAAERKFVDTIKSIFRKERESRKHLRLPYVAAMARFQKMLIGLGYDERMAWEIAGRAAEVATLEFECEGAA